MCWFFEFEELTPINLIQLLFSINFFFSKFEMNFCFFSLKTLISTIWVKNHQRSSFFRNMKHPEMNFCLFSIHWPLFQIMVVLVFWIWRVNIDKFDPIAFLTLKTLISTIWVKNHQRSSFFRNMKHPEMNFCLFSIHWPLFQIMVVLVFWIWRVNTDKFDPIAFFNT